MSHSKMILLTFVSVSLFVGLSVLAWGGFGPFLAHPPFVAFVAVSYVAALVGSLSSASISTGEREDKGNRWVLAVLGVLGLLAAYLPAYTDRIGFLTIRGETVRWVGVALYTLGCAVRIWPVFVLGKRFSGLVAIQQDHKLVTDGVYSVIRNPSYLGLLILMIGMSLVFRSGVGLILATSSLIALVPRMNSEEALLSSQFGAEYEAYRGRTWRLVPFLY